MSIISQFKKRDRQSKAFFLKTTACYFRLYKIVYICSDRNITNQTVHFI